MSNVVLTIFGMVVTMIAFAAFSVVQLGKAEARAGRPPFERDDVVPANDEPGGFPNVA